MLKLVHIVGARPNFMKIAPLMRAVERENEKRPGAITQTLVHTGQHYDEAMSEAFFRDLDLPRPEINLEVGSGSHVAQLSRIMLAIEPVLLASRPDWVVVVGDVNSTLAGALVASKLGVRVAHVEAGLRSFDRTMPEEINRLLTDQLSDLLLTPSADADANLLREGIDPARIARVGNVMIDSLHAQLGRARSSKILDTLGLAPREFAVATLHRPANVDHPATLAPLLDALGALSARLPVILPAHPRTQARLREFNLAVAPGVRVIDPLGYRDFLGLWSRARLVLTDSGGLQEETTALGIACLTLRENTERPVTVEEGTNRVVGRNPERILRAALEALDRPPDRSPRIPELWDGHSAGRIVEALLNRTAEIKERQ